jgi:hypothetical protein
MVNPSPPGPAGGEYGDVRATIDQVKLNAYLAKSVPAITAPVTVKQFKVSASFLTLPLRVRTNPSPRSLARLVPVTVMDTHSVLMGKYRWAVESDIFLDGRAVSLLL